MDARQLGITRLLHVALAWFRLGVVGFDVVRHILVALLQKLPLRHHSLQYIITAVEILIGALGGSPVLLQML